jgi:acetoin utilization deacetylase AcuC-like enzyme
LHVRSVCAFSPDLLLVSAGFDAHRKDDINMGYIGLDETDYNWLTLALARVANTCCHGRLISVLEGGYNICGGLVSPFARSVHAHVRALNDACVMRDIFRPEVSVCETGALWKIFSYTYVAQEYERESDLEQQLLEQKDSRRRQRDVARLVLERS